MWLSLYFGATLLQECSGLQERRRALHAQIVEAIERLYAVRLAEQAERLAHHALRGEVWGQALSYFRQAGAKAMARSAHREAVGYFEQALDVMRYIPEDRHAIEQTIDLRFELRNALQPLGEYGRILQSLREAERLAETLGDQRRLGWVSAYMTQHSRQTGDPEGAIESGRRALAIAKALGDFALQVMANLRLGQAYYSMGDYHRAIDFLGTRFSKAI